MSRVVMQQALDALEMMRGEYNEYGCPACDHADAAITALRQALAEPEQDKRTTVADLRDAIWLDPECADRGACQSLKFKGPAPTPRKPVELTNVEIALIVGDCAASANRHDDFSFARAVIAAYEAKQGEQT